MSQVIMRHSNRCIKPLYEMTNKPNPGGILPVHPAGLLDQGSRVRPGGAAWRQGVQLYEKRTRPNIKTKAKPDIPLTRQLTTVHGYQVKLGLKPGFTVTASEATDQVVDADILVP